MPEDLRQALADAPLAEAAWGNLTPIGRRDFANWINEAKLPETRKTRVVDALATLVDGRRRPGPSER